MGSGFWISGIVLGNPGRQEKQVSGSDVDESGLVSLAFHFYHYCGGECPQYISRAWWQYAYSSWQAESGNWPTLSTCQNSMGGGTLRLVVTLNRRVQFTSFVNAVKVWECHCFSPDWWRTIGVGGFGWQWEAEQNRSHGGQIPRTHKY